jgi:hypothetical protein
VVRKFGTDIEFSLSIFQNSLHLSKRFAPLSPLSRSCCSCYRSAACAISLLLIYHASYVPSIAFLDHIANDK